MSEKPYYEQSYQAPKSDIPDPSFGEIFKGLFLYPFTWNARSTRKGFWIAYVIQFVASLILSGFAFAALVPSAYVYSSNTEFNFNVGTWSVVTIILELIVLVLAIWVKLGILGYAVRRLHDTNHSGWWLWLMFIPFGWIVVLYFMILPTLQEPVQWGSYLFTNY